jgi:3-isopropylmalate/(R)-2-methylmalate dehydratase large subunit
MSKPETLFDKIWNLHVIHEEDGECLLYVDRALIHDGSSHEFANLASQQRSVARPRQVLAFSDHYAQTVGRDKGISGISVVEIREMAERVIENTSRYGITHVGLDDPEQGILHVVPPEQGITQPGMLIVGADSHTSTHGAFGCLAFGIGASEMTHVMATQTLWQRKPGKYRIIVNGMLSEGVSAKDLILTIIAKIGINGAAGHAVEYAGPAIAALSMEGRMTVCNMSIEAGARAGMIAPDDTTFTYLRGRPRAPVGQAWTDAMEFWRSLPSQFTAQFSRELVLDASVIEPTVTWGTNPEHAVPITGRVPKPDDATDELKRREIEDALAYMALEPGTPLEGIPIDHVFIGSCTNSRIEDLRAAAEVARLGRVRVPAWVVPGSRAVQRQAQQEGLDEIFKKAGYEWRDPGCSMCTGINGDVLKQGQRCASTSNRNFKGRQGPDAKTHVVSPIMAAAVALTGRLTDVRALLRGAG